MAEPTILNEIAAVLLAEANQCLTDHTTLGEPGATFLGHGDSGVPRVCCDYLSLQVGPLVPVVDGRQQIDPAKPCRDIEWQATFTLRLRRKCYPHISGEDPAKVFPDPDELTAASEALLIDARALTCCLLAKHAAGEVFANPNLPEAAQDFAPLQVVWGALAPFREAYCAGWDWPIQATVPACCVLPPAASGSGGSS